MCKKRVLFVESELVEERYEVVLNWRGYPEEKLEFYAESFHEAGKALLNVYGKTAAMIDFEACPIVYLYRHSLELYFKGFLITGDKLLSLYSEKNIDRSNIFTKHKLKLFWGDFERICKLIQWEFNCGPNGPSNKNQFEAIIDEFDKFDKQSFSFRYPMNTKGKSSLPDNFRFDIKLFCDTLDPILKSLQGGIQLIEDTFEQECLNRAEIKSLE